MNNFHIVKSVPYNEHGKLDIKLLTASENIIWNNDKNNPVSLKCNHMIVDILEEVLNTKINSLKINFFDLGGDSIKAIILISKLKKIGYDKIEIFDILNAENLEVFIQLCNN